MNIRFAKCLLWIAVLTCYSVTAVGAQDAAYSLTVMHTNDTRANHLPNADGEGGDARLATVVQNIRAEVDNSLLVDAGGRFTGTLFHRVYAGQDNVQIMNALGYQAMTIGNPEFDNGDEVLAHFIEGVDFPVLAANINATRSDELAGKIQPSTIITVGGEDIGIVGVTTDTIPRVSSPSRNLTFSGSYRGAVQAQVDAMTALGVNKIVLLSYLGYDQDVELAPQLSGVDLIVGGNTRTLLSNTQADAAGAYPTELTDADGSPVLIVQSGGGQRGELRFVGRIDLNFDADGVLTDWSGDTILLAADIDPDPDIERLVDDLNEQVQLEYERVIRTEAGESVTVEQDYTVDDCRIRECALGNLVADALRWRAGTQLALMNGGGMRLGLNTGTLFRGAVLEFLPFTNRMTSFQIQGADLVLALENGVSRVGESSGTGRFPQVSGMRYSYDVSKPVFERIISVDILGDDGEYAPLDPDELYTIATNDFARKGGDGYQVFADRGIDPADTLIFFDDVLIDYVREHSPINPEIEGRITALNTP